jgi:hypothetical protein
VSQVLDSPGKGSTFPPPVTVDDGCDVPSLSSSVGEVDHFGLLCLEHGLAVVQFSQLGFNGCSFSSKFAPCCAALCSASAYKTHCCSGRSLVFGCGMVVRNGTVGMVRGTGVPSSGSVVTIRMAGVTTLQH